MRRDTGRPAGGSPRALLAGSLDLVAKHYSAARQVVWRDLDRDAVPLKHADSKAPHVAAEGRQDRVAVGQLDTERRVGEDFSDLSLELDWFFFRHRSGKPTVASGEWGVRSAQMKTAPFDAVSLS